MVQILYLGVEGVLFECRYASARHPRWQHQTPPTTPLPLLDAISRLVTGRRELAIVLNSRMVSDYGYRTIVNLLPHSIAALTIGATSPGNRLHRHDAILSRVELLRADIRRRCPAHLVIVDASSFAIPYEYLDVAVHVAPLQARAAAVVADHILHLLTPETRTESYAIGAPASHASPRSV